MAQPTTKLGARLRAARIAKDWKLKELSERTNLTPGFLSRLELGHVAGGASRETLKKMTDVLGVPLDELMRLKDEDEGYAELEYEQPAGLGEDEQRILSYYRGVDAPVKEYLVQNARLANTFFSGSKLNRFLVSSARVNKQLFDLFLKQGDTWEEIANQLRHLPRFEEALSAYKEAEAVYENLRYDGALARLHYLMGYAFLDHSDKYGSELPNQNEILHSAISYLKQAGKEFDVAPGLTGEQKSRIPENLGKLSEAELRLAMLLEKQEDHGVNTGEAKRLRSDALSLQNKAITLLNQTVGDLEARTQGRTEAKGNAKIDWSLVQDLADAHCKIGDIYRLIAEDRAEELSKRQTAFKNCKMHLIEAIREWQILVKHSVSPENISIFLDKLAWTHANLGSKIFQIGPLVTKESVSVIQKEACHQYTVAERLYHLNETNVHNPRSVNRLARDLDLLYDGLDINTQKEITDCVSKIFEGYKPGTKENPNLDYTLFYAPELA